MRYLLQRCSLVLVFALMGCASSKPYTPTPGQEVAWDTCRDDVDSYVARSTDGVELTEPETECGLVRMLRFCLANRGDYHDVKDTLTEAERIACVNHGGDTQQVRVLYNGYRLRFH
jgi:hypothetical protein